jgi:hypothetical protein
LGKRKPSGWRSMRSRLSECLEISSLANIRKGQLEKVLVAALLRERTAVGNPWIAQRLAMGHSGSVSRLVVACGKSVTQTRELEKLKKMLKCDTDPIYAPCRTPALTVQ